MRAYLAILICAGWLVPAAEAQLFSDHFTRTNDPGSLSPWGTNAGGGNWTVTGGVMKGGLNPAFSYGFAFITNTFTNFSVQARFQFPVGAFGGGLGGRFTPANGTHYAAWIYPENSAGGSNILRLIRFDSYSTFTELQHTNLAAVGTAFHTVQLQFSGSQINVYFDTNRVIGATDASYASGAVSLDMWTDAAAYQMTVDDVVVTALPLGATNDSYTAVLGMPLTVAAPGVLANDTGGNGPLSAVLATNAAHGTLTLNSNGGFTYNATNNFTGTDKFAYRASDGQTSSSPAIVTITVTPDHPPVANSDLYSVLLNTTLSVSAPGVLANDTDVDGNSLTAILATGPSNGTLNLTNNGGFTYTPTPGFVGTDVFTYLASDGLSNSTVVATVTISVLPPALFSDDFTRGADPGPLAPWQSNLGNWSVTGGVLQGGPSTLNGYGFAYITNNWTNYSVQAQLRFPVGAFGGGVGGRLNPATGTQYAAWLYPEGSTGGANTLALIKFSNYGSFSPLITPIALTSVGTNFHTLKLGFFGTQIAVYLDGVLKISFSDASYSSGSVIMDMWTDAAAYAMAFDNVIVNNLAADDAYSTTQDSPLTVAPPGVLANDTAVFGTNLTSAQVTGPTHGTLSLSTNGSFTFTPAAGYTGPDSFTYQANDGATNLGIATVNIAVTAGAASSRLFFESFDGVTAPALPAGWTTSTSGAQSAWVTRTTTNDTAPNAVFSTDAAAKGINELVSPPIALPGGQARLAFRNNYNLEFDTAHPTNAYDGGVLEIKIGAGEYTDILDAGGSFVSGGYNTVVSLAYTNQLAGRRAWSGNSAGFITTLLNLPAAAAGQIIQLRWRCATDGSTGGTGWYIDTVAITNCACACCWNTPPLLAAQTNRTIDELTTLTVTNPATDADLPSQNLTYTLVGAPSGAGITNGVITWTPTEAQGPGTYTITTRATDDGSPALSTSNSFTVAVNEVNIAPTLPTQTDRTIVELTTLTVTNTAIDTDLPANPMTYSFLEAPTNATISTNGVITWTPNEAQGPGTNTFTTRVVDSGVPPFSATNTFTVVVNESNSPPVLPLQPNLTIAVLSTLTVTNTAIDSDLPANTLTYTLLAGPTNAVCDANTGVITWTPTPAQDGTTNVFTMAVTDFNPVAVNAQQLSATNSFSVIAVSGPWVVLDATALVGEGFLPTNNSVDPGETVTMRFALKNVGAADTTNLVVTLLPGGGVVAPNGSQSYGALVAGGSAVSQLFTFTASGTCGGTITPTLQLQDGATNYGPVVVSFSMGQAGTIFTQNFDTVTAPALPSGWTTSASNAQSGWVTTNSLADTAPNAAYSIDATNVGVNELVTPPTLLSLGQAQLSFRQRYSFEADSLLATNAYDGGVLEIKIGTNAFTDITNNGGAWIANGYTRRINAGFSNPLSGRWAWSGTNGSFVTTAVALPPASAGQTIQLRWRAGSDTTKGGAGWWVDSVAITGTVCGTNTPPVLPVQTDQTINELAALTVTNTANDLESPPELLLYSLLAGPTNASISTNGVITWTPTEAQGPGVYTFTTVVSDNASPSLSATNTFAVKVNEVNSAPVLTLPADQTINELVPWSANATAVDTDQPPNTLTFELVAGPGGLTVSSGGLISWTPTEAQGPGTNTVTVRVFDNGVPSLSQTNSFTVTVNEVNSAPVLTLPANQTINELVPWSANATAIDTDQPPNTLTFELVAGPGSLTVSPGGLISWTPTEAQGPSTNTVTVRVFDDGVPSLSQTNSFTLTVNEVNSAPVLTLPANQTINELVLWSASATAIDTDLPPNALTFALVSGPDGLAVSSGGLISWTPSDAQAGTTNTVTVRVFDDGVPVLSDTNHFILTVSPATNAALPVIQSISLSNDIVTVTWSSVAGRTYRLQYQDSLPATNWNDILPEVPATGSTATSTNALGGALQRYFRVYMVP